MWKWKALARLPFGIRSHAPKENSSFNCPTGARSAPYRFSAIKQNQVQKPVLDSFLGATPSASLRQRNLSSGRRMSSRKPSDIQKAWSSRGFALGTLLPTSGRSEIKPIAKGLVQESPPSAQTKEDPVWLTEKGSHFATHEAPEMKETEVRLTVSPRASDSLGCVGMYPDVGLSKSFFGDNLCRESSGRRYTTLHGYI